jgi:hypothetical protein
LLHASDRKDTAPAAFGHRGRKHCGACVRGRNVNPVLPFHVVLCQFRPGFADLIRRIEDKYIDLPKCSDGRFGKIPSGIRFPKIVSKHRRASTGRGDEPRCRVALGRIAGSVDSNVGADICKRQCYRLADPAPRTRHERGTTGEDRAFFHSLRYLR